MTAALVILVLVLWLATIVVNGLKGKYVFTVLAILGSLWAVIGAIRLAKPNSWWARHRYLPLEDPERPSSYGKMRLSIERYANRPWPLKQTHHPSGELAQ